jgi:hypothetical protein
MTRLPPQPPGNLDHAAAAILELEVTLPQAMLIDYIHMYQAQIDPTSRSGQRWMFTLRAGKGRLLSRSMAISNSMTVPKSLHRGIIPILVASGPERPRDVPFGSGQRCGKFRLPFAEELTNVGAILPGSLLVHSWRVLVRV